MPINTEANLGVVLASVRFDMNIRNPLFAGVSNDLVHQPDDDTVIFIDGGVVQTIVVCLVLCGDIELSKYRRDRFMRVAFFEIRFGGAEISQDVIAQADGKLDLFS